jgi:predicted nucleotidyltransferase
MPTQAQYNALMFPDRPLHALEPVRRAALVDAIRERLLREPRVLFAYVYGSFPGSGPFHDIDVGVWTDARSADDAARHAFDLAGRLEQQVPFPVDVVALNGRPVSFRFHVYRGELLFARDEEALSRELERTMAEYFDIEPVLRQATREAFGE